MLPPIKPRSFKMQSQEFERADTPFGLERDGVQQSTQMALYRGRDGSLYRRRSGGGWDFWDEQAVDESGRRGVYQPIDPTVIRDRQAGLSSAQVQAPRQQTQPESDGWMQTAQNVATQGWQMYGDMRRDIGRAATAHQERIPGVSEIGWQPIPSEREGLAGWLDTTRKGFATSGSRFLNSTDEAMLQQLLRHNPNLQISTDERVLPQLRQAGVVPEDFEIPRSEGEPPRIMVRHSPDSDWAYVNAPGISTSELQQAGIDFFKYLPVTRLAGLGNTVLRRIGIGAAAGSVLENVSEAIGEAVGVGEYNARRATATGFLGGGLGQGLDEAISPFVRQGARTVAQNVPMQNRSAQVTQQADLPPLMDRSPAAQRARAEAAQEQGIPLTQAQTTRRASDFDAEARAAAGSRGDRAADVINTRLAEQRQAANDTAERIIQGGGTQTDDEAANVVVQNLAEQAEQSNANVNQLYDAARSGAIREYNAGARVAPASATRLGALRDQAVRQAREQSGVRINEDTGHAQRVMAEINELVTRIEAGDVGLNDIDIARKSIALSRRNAFRGDTANDQIATTSLQRAFDDWFDEVITRQQYSGRPETVDAFRQARAASRRHHEEFGSTGSTDVGGRWVERTLALDGADLSQFNGILTARGGPTAKGVPVVRRLRALYARRAGMKDTGSRRELARQQPAFEALREGALRRGLQGLVPDNMAGPKFTPRSVVKRFGDWLDNGAFLRELFDPQEIAQLKRLHAVMEQLPFDSAMTNPSGTADAMMRAMGSVMQGFDSPMQAVLRRVLTLVMDLGENAADAPARQMRRATGGQQGYRPAPGTGVSGAGAAAGVAGAEDLRRQGEARRRP